VAPGGPRKKERGGQGESGGAKIVTVKELKRVKKPKASRPQTELGLEVSTLAVYPPLLHGPC